MVIIKTNRYCAAHYNTNVEVYDYQYFFLKIQKQALVSSCWSVELCWFKVITPRLNGLRSWKSLILKPFTYTKNTERRKISRLLIPIRDFLANIL